MEALLFVRPDSHCCSLVTNPGSQCFSLENGVTTACYPGNHCCSLPQGTFAAGSYPSKSLLLASPWCHLLLLLASDRPESPCCFLTQGVTATRNLRSHCSSLPQEVTAPKSRESLLLQALICCLKVARNSFHFPQASFTNSFSKYSLVYRISLKFTTMINEKS